MAMETFVVVAASYDTLSAAEADYHAVSEVYLASGLIDTYDAAVITFGDTGTVRIVEKREQRTRQGAWRGLGIGLAGGALVALFPAIGLGAGLPPGGAGSSGLSAMAGHVAAGLRRADLKDLGELLDEAHSGLVVVATSDLGEHVEQVIRRASGLTRKQLRVDEARVGSDIDAVASFPAPEEPGQDQSYRQAVAEAEAAVREAEAEAEAAEREAEAYSTFRSPWSPPRDADVATRLDDLTRLRESGVLSVAEFEAAKAKLLGQ